MDSQRLSDGGEIEISCSACQMPLACIWITRPSETTKLKIAPIVCPNCGDHSFVKEVCGGIHIGPSEYTLLVNTDWTDKVCIEVIASDKKYDRNRIARGK